MLLLYHILAEIHIDAIDFYMDKIDFFEKMNFFS